MVKQQQVQKKALSQSVPKSDLTFLQTRPFALSSFTENSIDQEKAPTIQAQAEHTSGLSHNFANLQIQPAATIVIQPKLTIGQPGDKYEQEADRVAEEVVGRIQASKGFVAPAGQPIQRQETPEEDNLQMKPLANSIQRLEMPEEELQMKPIIQHQAGVEGMDASIELESSINRARGSGQSLASSIRQPMEQAFGADFSGVRVHTDRQSDKLNRSIQAKAFTTGHDIFFRQGMYDPGSRSGQELLAHELTHVVQQDGSSVQRYQKKPLTEQHNSIPIAVSVMTSAAPVASLMIQRNIMDVETFKKISNVWTARRPEKMVLIDNNLEKYHENKDIRYLQHLVKKIDSALDDPELKSERKDALTVLRSQVQATLNSKSYYFQLWSTEEFLNKTKQKGASNSSFQDEIVKLLEQFHRLEDPYDKDLETAIGLIYDIQDQALYWREQYKDRKKQNREERAAGMQEFLNHIKSQIPKIEGHLDFKPPTSTGNGTQTNSVSEPSRSERVQEIRDKHVGSAKSIFAKAGGFLVDKLVGEAGDKVEIDLEAQFPVDATGTAFIGGHFNFEAEREKEETTVRSEISLTGGIKIPKITEIKGELGGYTEAKAKTPEQAMKLISYAFYRRLRESRYTPREMANYIWGGRSSDLGYKISERWAGNVEKEIFGAEGGDEHYVEMGGLAAFSSEVGNDETAKLGFKVKGTSGKKYTKQSIEEGKGQLGKTADVPKVRGTTQSALGKGVEAVEYVLSLSGGILSGELKLKLQEYLENVNLEGEIKGHAKIPGGEGILKVLAPHIDTAIMSVVNFLRSRKKLRNDNNVTVKSLATDNAITAVANVPGWLDHYSPDWQTKTTNYAKEKINDATGKQTFKIAQNTAPKAKEESPIESSRNIGVAVKLSYENNQFSFLVSLERINETKADLGMFKGSYKKSQRFIGFKYEGENWSMV